MDKRISFPNWAWIGNKLRANHPSMPRPEHASKHVWTMGWSRRRFLWSWGAKIFWPQRRDSWPIVLLVKIQGTSWGFTSADLTSWVNLHSEIPSGLDTAFVADHFVIIEGITSPKATFGVAITAPILVRVMGKEPFPKSGCLHIDVTYKLLW